MFPGGALDQADFDSAGGDVVAASRIAAAREAQEESGLLPHLEDMVLLSHWTTPVVEPKRFSTWIYAAPVAVDEEVVIILDYLQRQNIIDQIGGQTNGEDTRGARTDTA